MEDRKRSAGGREGAKVYFGMSVSLDGFINGPDGDLSWHKVDDELFSHFIEIDRRTGWHVYGRGLYETMQYWETFREEDAPPGDTLMAEYARIWEELPKLVVSRTLESVSGNARLLAGDLADAIVELKKTSEGDISVGGASLAGSLAQLGLIDEYHRYVTPVVIGDGTPFFHPRIDPFELELLETQTFGSGVLLERYRPLTAQ